MAWIFDRVLNIIQKINFGLFYQRRRNSYLKSAELKNEGQFQKNQEQHLRNVLLAQDILLRDAEHKARVATYRMQAAIDEVKGAEEVRKMRLENDGLALRNEKLHLENVGYALEIEAKAERVRELSAKTVTLELANRMTQYRFAASALLRLPPVPAIKLIGFSVKDEKSRN